MSNEAFMRTFHLTIAYDGTDFAGWQVQTRKRTIQGELERVIAPLYRSCGGDGDPPRVLGSGRTDSGVHAVGQVARIVLPQWNSSTDALARAINSKLNDAIVVTSIRETQTDFHPIRDAVAKTYRFRLHVNRSRDPFVSRFAHRVAGPIDFDAMNDAAARLVGTHDFAAFQCSGAPRQTTVRTLTVCRWVAVSPSASMTGQGVAESPETSQHWAMDICGNGFLYNMVRNLVGTMLDVGRRRHPAAWIEEVLHSRDRRRGGKTAAACGLCLMKVDYPEEIFLKNDT